MTALRPPRRPVRATIATATAGMLLLSACAGGGVGGGVADDGTDACHAQSSELDRSGAFFAAPIVAGVAVIGAGGVLGTRPGIIGGLVWPPPPPPPPRRR